MAYFQHWMLVVGMGMMTCIFMSNGSTDPTDVRCSALNATTLVINWTQATDPSVAGYKLDIERVDGLVKETPIETVTLNDKLYETYSYYGMGTYAEYSVTLQSVLTSGTDGADKVIRCKTLSEVPSAATFNLTCWGISETEIECEWKSLPQVYWNGDGKGYQLRYIGLINDEWDTLDIGLDKTEYVVPRLAFDTRYVLQLRFQNDAGFGPMTSATAKTLGWPESTENVTRYYCYQVLPGYLEIVDWMEMTCAVYTGTIAGLLFLTLVLGLILCCRKSDTSKSSTQIAVNMTSNEDDEDDIEEEYETDDQSEYDDNNSDATDYDEEENIGMDGKPTVAALAAKKKRKTSNDESEVDDGYDDDGDSENSTETENEDDANKNKSINVLMSKETKDKIDEHKTDSIENTEEEDDDGEEEETEEEDDEISDTNEDNLTADEKLSKKENKLETLRVAKELKATKKEERKQKHALKTAKTEKQKEENRKIKKANEPETKDASDNTELVKTNGRETLLNVNKKEDTNKKSKMTKQRKIKPRRGYSSDDDDNEEVDDDAYYEDWNPDTEQNPEIMVNKVEVDKDGNKKPTNNDSSNKEKKSSNKRNRINNTKRKLSEKDTGNKRSKDNDNNEKDSINRIDNADDRDDDNDDGDGYTEDGDNSDDGDGYNDDGDGNDTNDGDDYTDDGDDTDDDTDDDNYDADDNDVDDVDLSNKKELKDVKTKKKVGFFSSLFGGNKTNTQSNGKAKTNNDRDTTISNSNHPANSGKMAGNTQKENYDNTLVHPKVNPHLYKKHLFNAQPDQKVDYGDWDEGNSNADYFHKNATNTATHGYGLSSDSSSPLTQQAKYSVTYMKHQNGTTETMNMKTPTGYERQHDGTMKRKSDYNNPITPLGFSKVADSIIKPEQHIYDSNTGVELKQNETEKRAKFNALFKTKARIKKNQQAQINTHDDADRPQGHTNNDIANSSMPEGNRNQPYSNPNVQVVRYGSPAQTYRTGPDTRLSSPSHVQVTGNKDLLINQSDGLAGPRPRPSHNGNDDVHTNNLHEQSEDGPSGDSLRRNVPDHPKKLVSFRTTYPASSSIKSNQQHGHLQKPLVNEGDEDIEYHVADNQGGSSRRTPTSFVSGNKPAWQMQVPKDISQKDLFSGRRSKTPVKDISKRNERQSLTDPEPVFNTDRLGIKFPFLKTKDDADIHKSNDPIRKNQSDSNLVLKGSMNTPKNGKMDNQFTRNSRPPLPNTMLDEEKGEVGKVNNIPDLRDKVFYGFGVGRWRYAAAKWLNMWKMKRKPVKTGDSNWD